MHSTADIIQEAAALPVEERIIVVDIPPCRTSCPIRTHGRDKTFLTYKIPFSILNQRKLPRELSRGSH